MFGSSVLPSCSMELAKTVLSLFGFFFFFFFEKRICSSSRRLNVFLILKQREKGKNTGKIIVMHYTARCTKMHLFSEVPAGFVGFGFVFCFFKCVVTKNTKVFTS